MPWITKSVCVAKCDFCGRESIIETTERPPSNWDVVKITRDSGTVCYEPVCYECSDNILKGSGRVVVELKTGGGRV